MGQCLKKQTDEQRSETLAGVLLQLQEIAHTHTERKKEIDKEMQTVQEQKDKFISLFRSKKLSRDAFKRLVTDIEVQMARLMDRLTQVNVQIANNAAKADEIRDFAVVLTTSNKMGKVVNDLSSVGFSAEKLQKMQDKEKEALDAVREANTEQSQIAAQENTVSVIDYNAQADTAVEALLQQLEDEEALELEIQLGNVKPAKGRSLKPEDMRANLLEKNGGRSDVHSIQEREYRVRDEEEEEKSDMFSEEALH